MSLTLINECGLNLAIQDRPVRACPIKAAGTRVRHEYADGSQDAVFASSPARGARRREAGAIQNACVGGLPVRRSRAEGEAGGALSVFSTIRRWRSARPPATRSLR